MKALTTENVFVLRNLEGEPVRLIRTEKNSLALVKNLDTRRLEIVEADSDWKDFSVLLQRIEIDNKTKSIPLKNVGSLSVHTDEDLVCLDPRPLKNDEPKFPVMIKWSSISHGAILSILVLFAFLMPSKRLTPKETKQELVTLKLEKPESPMAKVLSPPPPPTPTKMKEPVSLKNKKLVRVVPRVDKSKPLAVKQKVIPRSNRPKTKVAVAAPTQFQRLGSLGAISNALKGSRSGMGSGLRSSGGGTGGIGHGAGMGRGNGTMGHGHDSGGGYEQALYGKGLIAGQVGAGGGGYGSGWGSGTRGSGGFGTKGKGGGHVGYGTSKIGSGASNFTYPVREEAVVEGGLDREAVYLVIMKNLGQIIYCYELGLQQKPSLRGRVSVDFTINSQGRVGSCSIGSSSLKSAQVESCMIGKIKNWKFPQPVGGVNVDVNYPFALQRVSQN